MLLCIKLQKQRKRIGELTSSQEEKEEKVTQAKSKYYEPIYKLSCITACRGEGMYILYVDKKAMIHIKH